MIYNHIIKPYNNINYTICLNGKLIKDKQLSDDSILKISKLYYKLDLIFKIIEQKDLNKKYTLQLLLKKIEKIEFKLQILWGFDENNAFHSYWYKIPNCTCPKIDNQDLFGTKYRIYNKLCPIHNNGELDV